MKANELHPCGLCGLGLMHSGLPLFYRLTIERMAVDPKAVVERHALGMLMGSPALAEVFSARSEVASPIDGPHTLLICEPCSVKLDGECVARLNEIAQERKLVPA